MSSRPPIGIGRGLLARATTTAGTHMTTTETQTADLLADLPALLAGEPAVRAVIDRAPVVAVPEPARALYLAALTRVTTRRPILVTVPTAAEAERVAHDLTRYLGRDAGVELFPAWETLPFERVSPSLDTMGRRLRVIWKLRAGGEQLPDVVVAPVRALVQRLGPHVEDVEPIRIHPGTQVDRDALVNRLVSFGYRREYQVEARGEVAVRGSIVDVYPATDDHPVRIDLWGDEVDRLSRFSVADQRSTDEIDQSWVFPARELVPSDEVRERAARLVGSEPWGREQWERLADGQVFDGMESWLPWLGDRGARRAQIAGHAPSCRRGLRPDRRRHRGPHAPAAGPPRPRYPRRARRRWRGDGGAPPRRARRRGLHHNPRRRAGRDRNRGR